MGGEGACAAGEEGWVESAGSKKASIEEKECADGWVDMMRWELWMGRASDGDGDELTLDEEE